MGRTGGQTRSRSWLPHGVTQEAVNDLPDSGPWTVCVDDGTYNESVTISGKNPAAAGAGNSIIIRAVNPWQAIVCRTGPGKESYHAFYLEKSKFITIQDFKIMCATHEAVFVKGGLTLGNHDITIKGNEITLNGKSSTNGGIFIGRETATGSTGGRCGVRRGPSSHNYSQNIVLVDDAIASNTGGDLCKPADILDAGDSGNCTTPGNEAVPPIIVPCPVTNCAVLCP